MRTGVVAACSLHARRDGDMSAARSRSCLLVAKRWASLRHQVISEPGTDKALDAAWAGKVVFASEVEEMAAQLQLYRCAASPQMHATEEQDTSRMWQACMRAGTSGMPCSRKARRTGDACMHETRP